MIPELIKLFNCVAVRPGEHLFKAETVNMLAARCGYLVHPDACTQDVVKFLESRQANFNSTFYESWEQVDSLHEAEMKVLQLVHYLSTYGTDYQGKTFTMNDFPKEMRFTTFTILMPCTEEELFSRITEMLESGIALNTETLDLIFEQALIYKREYGWSLVPEKIRNREAKAKYFISEGIYPYDGVELMRILMVAVKGSAMIINDRNTFNAITFNIDRVMAIFHNFDERHLKALAGVFYRYKRLLLIMRRSAKSSPLLASKEFIATINSIRRLARIFHRPFCEGVLQSVLTGRHSIEQIDSALKDETSPFVLIRLLNYINSVFLNRECRTFPIRNGKVFVSLREKDDKISKNDISIIRRMVMGRLAALIRPNALREDGTPLTVRFPEHLELAAPVSEKMFIGAIPYGSSYRLKANNYIGIYWRNEWGTFDYDLWMVGADGQRIGWAADLKSGNILFSGDMTTANPEATEIMYCRGTWPDCTIRVNRYNGLQGSKVRLFFGCDNLEELPKSYMVNPDTIQLSEDLTSDSKEMTVGVIKNNMVYFASLGSGNLRLPALQGDSPISFEKAFADHFSSYTGLREVLLGVGFKEYDHTFAAEPDIDLSGKLSKDTLISLLTPKKVI